MVPLKVQGLSQISKQQYVIGDMKCVAIKYMNWMHAEPEAHLGMAVMKSALQIHAVNSMLGTPQSLLNLTRTYLKHPRICRSPTKSVFTYRVRRIGCVLPVELIFGKVRSRLERIVTFIIGRKYVSTRVLFFSGQKVNIKIKHLTCSLNFIRQIYFLYSSGGSLTISIAAFVRVP